MIFLKNLFSISVLIAAVAAQEFRLYCKSDTLIPPVNDYDFTAVLATPLSGEYTLSYSISDQFQRLDLLLIARGFPMDYAWIGLGFGSGMRNSDIIVVHQSRNGSYVHQHTGTDYDFGPPPLKRESDWLIDVESAGYTNNILFAQLSIPLSGLGRGPIELVSGQDMIWAWNANSGVNYRDSRFTYHGPNKAGGKTHGALTSFLRDEIVLVRDVSVDVQLFRVHGFGMISVYLFLVPLAVFLARYHKSYPWWFVAHATIQSIASAGITVFFIVILYATQAYNLSHSYLGTAIIGLTVFQVVFGGFTRLGMVREDVETFRLLKWIHISNGAIVLVLSAVQVALGIYILYPLYEIIQGTLEIWIVYGVLLTFWVLLFGFSEMRWWTKFRVPGNLMFSRGNIGEKSGRIPGDRQQELAKYQEISFDNDSKTRYYTWEQVDSLVREGMILVIGNGRFVYDASEWMRAHPGGKIILKSVAGTDISLDFFYEAGADAADFQPKKRMPVSKTSRSALPERSNQIPLNDKGLWSSESTSTMYTSASCSSAYSLLQEEWELVIKARRTHVHSRLALERLSSLLIGELESENVSDNVMVHSQFEYRRYAIVSKQCLTSGNGAKVFMVKFSLLYPFDVRANQPEAFQLGDSVEIQVKLSNDHVVSRYYTPIGGDLSAFEIIFKEIDTGVLTPYLSLQKPGVRQIKIRGTFHHDILVKTPYGYDLPENIVYLCAGSGITPFLQFLATVILPVNVPLAVVAEFVPSNTDEIALQPGQYVSVISHYYDGWAYGINLSNNYEGIFPLTVVAPDCGCESNKITLVNCAKTTNDIVGLQLIDAALISYPSRLTVHHIVSDLGEGIRDGVSGFIRESRLDETILGELLGETKGSRKAIVCGPTAFNSMVVDSLNSDLEWGSDEVVILGT